MYESHSEMKISCHETHLSSGLFWESECERIVHRTMRKVKSEERNEGKEGRLARQNDKRQKIRSRLASSAAVKAKMSVRHTAVEGDPGLI